jgi:hypothetical protein
MSQNDIIDLTELFIILKERLCPSVGYCTIYDILKDRKTFSFHEADSLIDQINKRHIIKNKIIAEKKPSQQLALVG